MIAYRSYAAGRLIHAARMSEAPGWDYGYQLASPICGLVMNGIRQTKYEPAASSDNVTCKRCYRLLAAEALALPAPSTPTLKAS
jgi:hypothetical protein